MYSPKWRTSLVTLSCEMITQGAERIPLPYVATVLGRGAMDKFKKEVVVRGSAAAVGLMVLVSVVGAGQKWN